MLLSRCQEKAARFQTTTGFVFFFKEVPFLDLAYLSFESMMQEDHDFKIRLSYTLSETLT